MRICVSYRDHFLYAPSLWETTLHCNVISHRLGAYRKWSLWYLLFQVRRRRVRSGRWSCQTQQPAWCGLTGRGWTCTRSMGTPAWMLWWRTPLLAVAAEHQTHTKWQHSPASPSIKHRALSCCSIQNSRSMWALVWAPRSSSITMAKWLWRAAMLMAFWYQAQDMWPTTATISKSTKQQRCMLGYF